MVHSISLVSTHTICKIQQNVISKISGVLLSWRTAMHKLGAFRTIMTDLIKIILRPHQNLHHHFKELVVAVVVYLIPVVVAAVLV